MPPRLRFAPSPTGFLHAGNLRTVIINWLFVRQSGGTLVLRLDDTDAARSQERFVDGIRADLAWLGIDYAQEERQSARTARYEAVFEQLRAAGRLYPCFETPEELDIRRKVQLSRGLPPVYDRAALKLSPEEIATRIAAGEAPHWRFKLNTEARILFEDLVQGATTVDPASVSDPVVRRADGGFLYMLPSVIDDVDMGITHVVRGQDHLSNSGVQIQMFEAMGATIPRFAHLSLLATKGGELSKRIGSAGVAHYQEQGIEPLAVMAYLGRLGTSLPIDPVTSPDALIAAFDWATFNKANALFDEAELTLLNAKIVRHLPYSAVANRLPATVTAPLWDAVRSNLDRVDDATDWVSVVNGPIDATLAAEEQPFLAAAKATLETLPWGDDIWLRWTAALKDQTGRKGKALFLPLRQALTGLDHGPDMALLLPLIGRETTLARLA